MLKNSSEKLLNFILKKMKMKMSVKAPENPKLPATIPHFSAETTF
jgi:hypothetical protein